MKIDNWKQLCDKSFWHDAANIFPCASSSELSAISKDIQEKGLQNAIVIIDGKILDGRNRIIACKRVNIEPFFRVWEPNGLTPTQWVISQNLTRRHLTKGQLACCAVEALSQFQKEARERQLAGITLPENSGKGESVDLAGKQFGVNGDYIHDAKQLKEEEPVLYQQVLSGEITLQQSLREHRKQTFVAPAIPEGKYRVIYADPPWKYSSSDSGLNQYGPAERHYDTLTIKQLCDLPIKEMAFDDSVLFLWVTSPMLENAFTIIKSWGFQYKTSFVWDKVGHNFGHYNSARHEFLLICTRGSCTPDSKQLLDSVVELKKTSTHSQKPEEFRAIIDLLYTSGPRIELFARTRPPKPWKAWGNELRKA